MMIESVKRCLHLQRLIHEKADSFTILYPISDELDETLLFLIKKMFSEHFLLITFLLHI